MPPGGEIALGSCVGPEDEEAVVPVLVSVGVCTGGGIY